MIKALPGDDMTQTIVRLHFIKDVINHRLRFGEPFKKIRLDKSRVLATFEPNIIFGYIRWKANEYGTQDWRVYILKTQSSGALSQIAGVSPAVKVLLSAVGKTSVKRALSVIDTIEKEAKDGLISVPESYWLTLHNTLLLRKSPRDLPLSYRNNEAFHVS